MLGIFLCQNEAHSTLSWLSDSLQTPRGTAWLGVPCGESCDTAMQEATGYAQCPAASGLPGSVRPQHAGAGMC